MRFFLVRACLRVRACVCVCVCVCVCACVCVSRAGAWQDFGGETLGALE